jgi:hypothetical protein
MPTMQRVRTEETTAAFQIQEEKLAVLVLQPQNLPSQKASGELLKE